MDFAGFPCRNEVALIVQVVARNGIMCMEKSHLFFKKCLCYVCLESLGRVIRVHADEDSLEVLAQISRRMSAYFGVGFGLRYDHRNAIQALLVECLVFHACRAEEYALSNDTIAGQHQSVCVRHLPHYLRVPAEPEAVRKHLGRESRRLRSQSFVARPADTHCPFAFAMALVHAPFV